VTLQEDIERALKKCDELGSTHTEDPVFDSIRLQLEYLAALDRGTITDRSRLKDIILEFQAAKEINTVDEEFAQLLFEIDARSKEM